MELQWVAYRAGHGEVLATFATFSLPPICAIKDAVPLMRAVEVEAKARGCAQIVLRTPRLSGASKQFADGCAVELWEGKRFIARIDGQDKPAC
jgi:hypothetical protein